MPAINTERMNQTLLHRARSIAWAFTAVLASTSALGAKAVPPWLTLEQQHSYPRIAWSNVHHGWLWQLFSQVLTGTNIVQSRIRVFPCRRMC